MQNFTTDVYFKSSILNLLCYDSKNIIFNSNLLKIFCLFTAEWLQTCCFWRLLFKGKPPNRTFVERVNHQHVRLVADLIFYDQIYINIQNSVVRTLDFFIILLVAWLLTIKIQIDFFEFDVVKILCKTN